MSILNAGILFAIGLLARATVVLGAASIAMLALRRASAATRHRVGTAGLGLALLLPVLSLVLPRIAVPFGGRLSVWTASAPRLPWLALALGVWAAGALVVAGRLLAGGLRVRRLADEASPIEDADWIED